MSDNTVSLVTQAIKAIRQENVKTVGFSWLQRRLRISYPRAARLVEELEAEGILSKEHICQSFERRVIGEEEMQCEEHIWEQSNNDFCVICIKCGCRMDGAQIS